MQYLHVLNERQRQAVETTEGPLLVLAGAGAGKTKMLTHRILHLIKKGVAPHEILAITFTNKAAGEMKERVFDLIKNDPELNLPISFHERPFVSTFHALGVHILREQCVKAQLPRSFSIADRADQMRIMKAAMKAEDIDSKQYEPRKILSIISKQKGAMVTLTEYEAEGHNDYMKQIVSKIWARYDKALKEEKTLDFDDLLLKSTLLLKNNPEVLEYYQNVWKYIHIDEYQDTNVVQYTMSKLLAGKYHNICVVGDIDQNIYTWRGATIKNIMNFERDYPEMKEILLEQNYRSTQIILGAANEIIKKNQMRKEKNLFTKNAEGELINLYNAFDEYDEARHVVDTIEDLLRNGAKTEDIAVLYRANFQSRILEEMFLERAIEYQVLGVRFFDRKEVKDMLCYIKTAMNPSDLGSLGRIINTPTRGIGKVTYLKICEGKQDELKGKTKEKVDAFWKKLADMKQAIETKKPSEVIKYIVKHSGIADDLATQGDEGTERLENIMEFASLAMKYDDLPEGEGILKLLEDAALASDQDSLDHKEEKKGVKLMTVHASKGLEFDYVFITGLEDGLFPHEDLHGDREDAEEERRLFYVALTRAGKKLYLSYAGMRTIYGSQQVKTPSEFIHDIPAEFIETNDFDPVSSSVKSIFIDF